MHQVKDANTCIAGFLQLCYSQPNCVAGSEIETPEVNPTPKDCCVRTNNGQSYADSGGNCIVPQCVGKRSDISKFTEENYGLKLYNYPISIFRYTRILCCDIPYHSVTSVYSSWFC